MNSFTIFKYPNYIESLEKVYFNNSVDIYKNQMIIIKTTEFVQFPKTKVFGNLQKDNNKYDFLYNDNIIII